MKMGGVCPRCSGVIESSIHVCEDHDAAPGERCRACWNADAVRVAWARGVCKYHVGSSVAAVAGLHPAAVAFYHERGVEVGYQVRDYERSRELLALLRAHEQELLSVDPLRVRVTIRHGGDELRLTLDEDLNAVDAERRYASVKSQSFRQKPISVPSLTEV